MTDQELFKALIGILEEPQELVQLCAPTEPEQSGLHKHKCPSCHTVWKHGDMRAILGTHEEFVTAHTCPSCGEQQTAKFRADDPWTHSAHVRIS